MWRMAHGYGLNWGGLLMAAGLLLAPARVFPATKPVKATGPGAASKIYQTTNVLTAHFTFSPEQWRAMEPTRTDGGGRMGGGLGGPGGPNLTGRTGGRNGLAAVRGIEFNYVHASLELAGARFTNVAVRYKGNGTYFRSQGSLKRSLKVDLNEFVKGQKLAGMTKLNFHSEISDPSWMIEPLSYGLYRDAGVPTPRTAYVKVYLTVPGQHDHTYMGLYAMVEDVDKHFAAEHFAEKKGAIFKPVGPNLFRYLGTNWAAYNQQYDPKTELTPGQSQRMMDFCQLITSANDQEFAKRIDSFLDLEEFSRFLAMTVCLSSLDSILGMSQNFYMYLDPKSNRFQFIPWDLDNSFGKFRMAGTQTEREQLSIMHPWQGDDRFIERVFQVPAFQKLYRARLQEFSQGIFKPDRIHKQVDAVAPVLRPAIKEESTAKLALFEKGLAGQSVAPDFGDGQPGGPRGARNQQNMNTPIKPIKLFVTARSKSLADQLDGKSQGSIITRRFGMGGR